MSDVNNRVGTCVSFVTYEEKMCSCMFQINGAQSMLTFIYFYEILFSQSENHRFV